MMKRSITINSVAVTGSFIGIISLLPGWITLKPNRLVEGTPLNVWEGAGWTGATVIASLWILCLILSLVPRKKLSGILLGITANTLLILTLVCVAMASRSLLAGAAGPVRVSLGIGFWTGIAAIYTVIFAARQQLSDRSVFRGVVSWSGLVIFAVLLFSGFFNYLSVLQEFAGYKQRFLQELLKHISLFSGTVAVASIIGILLGILATKNSYIARPIFFFTNIMQTIPGLALFGLLIAPLSALSFAFPVLRDVGIRGVGVAPAAITLIIYALLPIVRNTYVGMKQVATDAINAGMGMGMSRWQLFRRVEVPLASPLILEGIRMASIQAIGLTAIAALIGAGGLGWFVFRGIGQAAPDLIILGAIPIIVLALLVDAIMRTIIKLGTPRGLVLESR
ncbi:ABC transporter permease [Chloroflexota bacterium]